MGHVISLSCDTHHLASLSCHPAATRVMIRVLFPVYSSGLSSHVLWHCDASSLLFYSVCLLCVYSVSTVFVSCGDVEGKKRTIKSSSNHLIIVISLCVYYHVFCSLSAVCISHLIQRKETAMRHKTLVLSRSLMRWMVKAYSLDP